MTKQELIEFTNTYGYSIMLGTRDKELQPALVRGFGIKLNDDATSLSVIIPKMYSEKTLSNLQENNRVALAVGHIATMNSRQFKGTYISHGDPNENDLPSLQGNITVFGEICKQFYGEQMAEVFTGFNIFPLMSVTFKIEDIFNQTPGPGAGQKTN